MNETLKGLLQLLKRRWISAQRSDNPRSQATGNNARPIPVNTANKKTNRTHAGDS
jgi:hypothetical protein